jgi:hypothetical protein
MNLMAAAAIEESSLLNDNIFPSTTSMPNSKWL